MGRAEGPHEVSFTDEDSWTIRKKVGYVLGLLAACACIVVGLIVYYVGVMGIDCSDGNYLLTGGQLGSGQKPVISKPKVTYYKAYFIFNKVTRF